MNFRTIQARSPVSYTYELRGIDSFRGPYLSGFELYLVRNWDGDGAKPVSRKVLSRVRAFLAKNNLPKPSAAPSVDGSLGLLWKTAGVYLFLQFLAGGRVHYYFQIGNKSARERVLPTESSDGDLLDAIRKPLGVLLSLQSASFNGNPYPGGYRKITVNSNSSYLTT